MKLFETTKRLLKNKFSENLQKEVYKIKIHDIIKVQINHVACHRKGTKFIANH